MASSTVIDAKPLTASLIGTVEKTYDGTTSATLTSGNYSLVGFVGAQSATVTQTSGTYASPNAGSGIGVNATLAAGDFIAAPGTLLTNYVLPIGASGNVGLIDAKPPVPAKGSHGKERLAVLARTFTDDLLDMAGELKDEPDP